MKIDAENLMKLLSFFKDENGENEKDLSKDLMGKRVIVRSRNAGVMYGTLVGVNGQRVSLEDARIIYRWRNKNNGVALNDTAIDGLKDDDYSKLSHFNKRIEMLEACSIILCEKSAIDNLDKFPVFKAD